MVKIRLFCAAGFSTGMIVDKMRKAAEARGIEADIEACAQGEMERACEGIDVALLGPQVAYTLPKSKEICAAKGVPIDVIPMADYGTMNGEKILDFALNLANKK